MILPKTTYFSYTIGAFRYMNHYQLTLPRVYTYPRFLNNLRNNTIRHGTLCKHFIYNQFESNIQNVIKENFSEINYALLYILHTYACIDIDKPHLHKYMAVHLN